VEFDFPIHSHDDKVINLEYEKIQDVFMVIDFLSNIFEGEILKLLGSL
jgi:hypothetical protein